MEELEVIINNQVGTIDFNFDEMKAYLEDSLEEFKTAVFTDESIKSAKGYVADLRKQQKAFKDRITEVKKIYMAPFDAFKAKADELVRLYDEPINFINDQVQDYETRRKAEKRQVITEMYEEIFGEIKDLISLDRIYDPRWENATYKKSDIQKELIEKSTKITTEINIIRTNPSPYRDKAEEIYLKDYDIVNALQKIQEWELIRTEEAKRQQEIEERKRLEEIAKAEREKILAEMELEKAKSEAIENYIPDQTDEPEVNHLYSINLTPSEKEALEMYMDSVGIIWEEV